MKKQHYSGKHYIAGHWVEGSGLAFVSKNPATNEILWEGKAAATAEINQAAEAAHAALGSWSTCPMEERMIYLKAFADEVGQRRDELAKAIAMDNGKPFWEALTEVTAVIGKINLSIQAQLERNAEKITTASDSKSCLRYKPHGVVAVLGPFNFPAHLSNGHIVPALLAGNTVILKPSELTPLVAEMIMACWDATGIPAGVINCVQGDAATGKALLNADIQGVYFTGSYATGKRINQHFSERPEVILALEMGGNNPLIIDEIGDIEAAVYQTLLSSFITSGQRCTCARRLIIAQNATGDRFLDKLLAASRHLRVGDWTMQPEPFMGPVISHDHALGHLKAQDNLLQSGGKAILPMTLLKDESGLLSPGLIEMTRVSHPEDIELFAPLAQIYRYHDFDEALYLANQTRYGLAAGLLSDNAAHYQRFYQQVRAGLINWNKPTTGAASNLPFGGVGLSGNHRPSAYFAADYCSYPIASQEQEILQRPEQLLPGIFL
ncbi:succinylglutamate-semialdehyde dehydrogenase [Legionella erythra]|uniref:N-succinylglutamate 5-semialdehyde dehydrogenase n=1 Tax=Legionella erythra TaxID=448 RepID=A0A0W0TRI4_LEGER|nr:succinylglutamate-semialdehyde dehydrogenase [Legionella erythra]KTC97989.1 succinylglutamic-5-semialdehyde dehydrogenase [Legionella erythra]